MPFCYIKPLHVLYSIYLTGWIIFDQCQVCFSVVCACVWPILSLIGHLIPKSLEKQWQPCSLPIYTWGDVLCVCVCSLPFLSLKVTLVLLAWVQLDSDGTVCFPTSDLCYFHTCRERFVTFIPVVCLDFKWSPISSFFLLWHEYETPPCSPMFTFDNLHFFQNIHLFFFGLFFLLVLFLLASIYASAVFIKEAVKAHHLLVSKCLYSSTRSPYHEFPVRLAEPPLSIRERPRARVGMQNTG